jgi:stage III sporulation protein AH
MNTKRQTVWLVSMLGLMVVLSAYYLFTDEVGQTPNDTLALNEIQVEGTQLDAADGTEGIAAGHDAMNAEAEESTESTEPTDGAQDQVTQEASGATADDAAAEQESADTPDQAAAAEQSMTDEQVLQEITAKQSGDDAITAMQMERNEHFSQEFEELTATIASGDSSDEQVAAATKRHDELLDLDARLVAFEEKLISNNYSNVVVTYDEGKDHYTVNVSAPSLQKSEAVTIVKMALEDLKISMNQISVKLFK